MTELALCESADPGDLPGDWLAERKLDGIRGYTRDGRLFSRSGTDITAKFPELDLPGPDVDGEIVAIDGDLSTVTARVQRTGTFNIEMGARMAPVRLHAFDVLTFEGEDLRDRPLTARAGHLHAATKDHDGIVTVEPHDDPAGLWETALANGWEGIVVKDPTAPYPEGRTGDWLKAKAWEEAEFPIIDHELTDAGGFVVWVNIGTDEPQKVAVNGSADQRAVLAGAETATVQYLERSKHDRLRKPSLKAVA